MNSVDQKRILNNLNRNTGGAERLSTPLAIMLMEQHKNENCKRCWGKGYEIVDGLHILCRGKNCVAQRVHALKEKKDEAP